MLAIVFGSIFLYPSPSTSAIDETIGDLDRFRLSENEFYQEFNIEPLTEPWEWNSDDFIDYDLENVDYYDFMLYDNFEGENNTIKFTTEEEDTFLDLSVITPGIYTIENTSDLGYIYIGFGDYEDYLTVFDNQPIYNIPVIADIVIEVKNLDYAERNNVEFTFTKQDDYIYHDQDHMQGMFYNR